MTERPKPDDPGGTHVLDDEDIEELEQLTFTSVIRDAAKLPEPEPLEDKPLDVDDLEFDILSPEDVPSDSGD